MGRDGFGDQPAAGDVTVDRARRRLSRSHGIDQQARTMRQVAGDEDPSGGRLEGLRIDFRPAWAHHLDVLAAVFEKAQRRGLSHRRQHRVAPDNFALGVVKHGREAAILVVHAQAAPQLDSLDRSVFAPEDFDRTPAVEAAKTLLVALENLERVRGHLLETLERNQLDVRRVGQSRRRAGRVISGLTQHRTGDVIGNVAAADDDDVAANVKTLPQRDGPQEVDAAIDTRPALAGQPKSPRRLGADRDQHGREVTPELGERNVFPDRDAATNLDPERLDHRDLGRDHTAWQPIRRDAQGEHPSRPGLDLENDRLETQ